MWPGIIRVVFNSEAEWIYDFPGHWTADDDRWANRELRLAETAQDAMERNDRCVDYAVRWGARSKFVENGRVQYEPILRNPVRPYELAEYASRYGPASGLKPRGLMKMVNPTNEEGEWVQDCLWVQDYHMMDSQGRYESGECVIFEYRCTDSEYTSCDVSSWANLTTLNCSDAVAHCVVCAHCDLFVFQHFGEMLFLCFSD